MAEIKVGIIGVGNCASGLIQGVEYYRQKSDLRTGLIHHRIGDYSVTDLEFVSGFDIGETKVGKPIATAIYSPPNEVRWLDEVKGCKRVVIEAPILDGVGIFAEKMIRPVKQTRSVHELRKDIVEEVQDTGTRVLLNYLPVGSQKATEFWADVALETGCAFVNCIPVFIASDLEWSKRFEEKRLPIIGDDIKSQVGSTIVHRVLAKLCMDRGAVVDQTYQINVGGNTDFINMLERDRLESKKISKTEAVQSQLKDRLGEGKIYIGPSDFIPFLGNRKLAFIRIEGRMFANVPFNMEMRLDVDDKSTSGGTAIDAVRLAQLGLDRGVGGCLTYASAYLMKHPPVQMSDEAARTRLDEWIATSS
jgi:myo-inositol-1-phosphate synthase